jgi:proteasome lid subunit RPN8/RPN11
MVKISKQVIEDILLTAQDVYPNEFVGILKAVDGVVREIHIIPGSDFHKFSASYPRHRMTIDLNYVGTIHSHPGPRNNPSGGDLRTFSTFGKIHLIAKQPYQSKEDIACYDRQGNAIEFEVVEEASESDEK